MSQCAVARRLTPLRTAISVALLPLGPLRMTMRSDAGASLSPSKKISISIDECAGITIAPGPLFSAKGAYRNFIRLNAGSWSDRVRQAVVTLGKLASRS